jgi:hypothetical protein
MLQPARLQCQNKMVVASAVTSGGPSVVRFENRHILGLGRLARDLDVCFDVDLALDSEPAWA